MNVTSVRENVDLIELDNKRIFLVGTAHISHASADLAEEVIRETKPDSVAVELCDSRFQSLKDPEKWKNTDIVALIRSGRAYVLMAQLILASFQRKLGAQLNIRPGAEMLRSVSVAEELQCQTVLADRDVKTTLKRTWSGIGFWSGCRLIMSMMLGLVSKEKISAEEIEALKSKDALTEILNEFSEKFPSLRRTLIDERDRYLSAKIKSAPGNTIVAIVGAGHVPGIKSYLDQTIEISPLEIIPPKGIISKLIGWSIPALVLAFLVYGFFVAGGKLSLQMLEAWFWITGFMGAVGAALALAHPLTILTAFLATPLATLHPLIAAGWIAGLVEAWLRKPRVLDFETILDDLSSMRGIWHNRVSRILLVVALTNLLATIGMIWGAKVVAELAIFS